jgi:transposase
MKNRRNRVVFKDYNFNQTMLLPPSLEELIDPNHPVRIVNQVIDQIDADSLFRQYKGGGTSSYHPRILLKVMIYSYLCNVFSSRRMESALKENIHFMWLSGMSRPDHNTLNRFRSQRLKDVLKEIFAQVVFLLVESGHVSLHEIYVDGTKIESRANRYTFVWGNAIKTSKARMSEQLKALWEYTQTVAKDELQNTQSTDFQEISEEKVKQTINSIDQALKGKEIDSEVKKKLNYARKHWPDNMKRYHEQEKVLGNRNSFSKTDPDATFMRMKEDYMKNGQLKPGYNVQISTNNQYIVNYSHHPNPTDTLTLPTHLEQFNKLYDALPHDLVADAGYGSEENYSLLEKLGIKAYVKYNYFNKEQHKIKDKITNNLCYDKVQDCYYCPMGQKMNYIGTYTRKSDNGFVQQYKNYQAIRCDGCPLRTDCNKTDRTKILAVNQNLTNYKSKATELLKSEKGLYYRKKRGVDIEPVFGNIKYNKGFKRFYLKGKDNTEIETGLLALAHNLAKMAK